MSFEDFTRKFLLIRIAHSKSSSPKQLPWSTRRCDGKSIFSFWAQKKGKFSKSSAGPLLTANICHRQEKSFHSDNEGSKFEKIEGFQLKCLKGR